MLVGRYGINFSRYVPILIYIVKFGKTEFLGRSLIKFMARIFSLVVSIIL